MLDPQELYTIDAAAESALRLSPGEAGTGPVLVNALRGFVDAGHVGQVALEHILDLGETTRLVTFDADQLVDYRSKRPTIVFDTQRWTDYAGPSIAIDVARDREGTTFLVLHGNEPDVQWERFVEAVLSLVDRFRVSLTVGTYGIPMGIPHTRLLSATPHASRDELIPDASPWFGRVTVPATAANLLELRLSERGHDTVGYAVHVPHYLAQSTYPPAALVALDKLESATGLDLDLEGLEEAATEARAEVVRQIAESPEIAEVVRGLEEQYDAFTSSAERQSLLADTAEIPTADEIGEELERFLAQQGPDGQAS